MSQSRTVEVRYLVNLSELRQDHGRVDIWLPFPGETAHQQVMASRVTSEFPYQLHYDPVYGNAILHFNVESKELRDATIGYEAVVNRREWKVPFHKKATNPWPHDKNLAALHLRENRKIKFQPEVIEAANTIRDKYKTNLDIAHAAYDHVLATMEYDKSGDGWGNGDTAWACSMGKGNCTDFHSLFLAVIRAAGVPGQFEIGMAFPSNMSEGDITFFKCGYHCWTSFYTPEYGWVPADVSEAAQKSGLRDYFFGAVDENRVLLSRGRDIDLVPKQRGESENFFTEPRIETETGKGLVYEKKLEFASV
jgi:transglutaminase-like putative cysteine protease